MDELIFLRRCAPIARLSLLVARRTFYNLTDTCCAVAHIADAECPRPSFPLYLLDTINFRE